MLVDFYCQPSTTEKIRTIRLKSGGEIEEPFQAPTKPVHVVDFCDFIDITVGTFYNWCDPSHASYHPDFLEAYTHAKKYLERNVVDNALLNNYNGGFASLVSKNWFGWADKSEVKNDVNARVDTTPADPKIAAEFADYLKNKQ
jgi:hypothetical protein